MFMKLLKNADDIFKITQASFLPGIQTCHFSLRYKDKFPFSLAVDHSENTTDIIFCINGSMNLKRNDGAFLTLSKDEILVISDNAMLTSLQISTPVSGILVSFENSQYVNRISPFDHISDTEAISIFMHKNNDCVLFQNALWIQSLFLTLKELHIKDQCQYCIFKSVELFYLLSKQNYLLFDKNISTFKNSFLTGTVKNMKLYMEEHLDEKLTIDHMSRLFNISSTTFKISFRHLYGQPVHSWLQTQRMKRASEYLLTSSMTILQISQLVGYEGVSQFNVSFKRYYGMTPTQYRKMSYAGEMRPFQ